MLSRKLAQAIAKQRPEDLPAPVLDQLKRAFTDLLACLFEARNLPHCRQTLAAFPDRKHPESRAFVYAVLAHSLVREDMHTASVSHLGVVIYPALMALARDRPLRGDEFLVAAACGYEAGARIGEHLISGGMSASRRPTGTSGPLAAATALSKALQLDEKQTVSAVAIAANTCAGLNEWAASGADDMYLHPGFAARNALSAAQLAAAGLAASENALEGPAGLFASLSVSREAEAIDFFAGGEYAVMEVFFKPAPACNYAQTPCQVARLLCEREIFDPADIKSIRVHCSGAALAYPGCDARGPFTSSLQAKMSIQYNVAATLVQGDIAESNYRLPPAAGVMALIEGIELIRDPAYSAAYPARQGTSITLQWRHGGEATASLDDLIPASPEQVQSRFEQAAAGCLASRDAERLRLLLASLETQGDIRELLDLVDKALFAKAR